MRRLAVGRFHSATNTVASQVALKQCPQPVALLMDSERWWSLPWIWQYARTYSPIFMGSHNSDCKMISTRLPRRVCMVSILKHSFRRPRTVLVKILAIYPFFLEQKFYIHIK